MLIGGCSGDSTPDRSTSSVTRNSEPGIVQRTSDGILRIGILLPPEPFLDSAQRDDLRSILESAGRVIDAVGPPWIESVEIVFSDESTEVNRSSTTVQSLLDDGIDALIGPASSDVAGTIVRDVTAAGVGVCTPASTSVLMAKVPDDGLLIRTSPADDDIAAAMTREIDRRGYSTAAVFYPDTAYGTEFFDVLVRRMIELGVNLTSDGSIDPQVFFPYEPSQAGLTEALGRVPELAPSTVLVIGEESIAENILGAFEAKLVIVNDAFTNVSVAPDIAETYLRISTSFDGFAVDVFDGADQTISSLQTLDTSLELQTDGRIPLVANYVDCLNVLTLSSILAGTDLASDFMSQAVAATNSGSTCRTFVECIGEVGRGLNFDYDGWGKSLDLDEGGQVVDGPLVVYGLDPSGTMAFRRMHGS